VVGKSATTSEGTLLSAITITKSPAGQSRKSSKGHVISDKRANTKRAIVSLAEGHRIDIFGGPVS
jgi:large subunit ribosomal protein L23